MTLALTAAERGLIEGDGEETEAQTDEQAAGDVTRPVIAEVDAADTHDDVDRGEQAEGARLPVD